MRNKAANILLGLIFIVIGIAYAGNVFDFWNFDLLFPGWWTMFIIIPCVYSIIRDGFHSGGLIGLGIGVILLLNNLNIINNTSLWKLIIPFIIIAIGLTIIFKGFSRKNHANVILPPNGSIPSYSAFFGENSPNYTNTEFTGATASAVFGGVTLDLRNSIINNDCVIDSSSIFGGTDIFLPPNVKVKVSSTPIFGGVENRANNSTAENAPTVFINATCIFGGTDIK